MKTIGLILAGGVGSRFWPLSRKNYPKQVLKLVGDREMINLTIDRCDPFITGTDMHIITNREQAALLAEITGGRIPSGNIFIEPCGRNTAPCMLYSLMKLAKKYGDAVVCVLSADQAIKDEHEFRKVLKNGAEYAACHDSIVAIGIVPTFPSTGYGYIKKGQRQEAPFDLYRVEQFVEKPCQAKAEEYIGSGGYLWNSGMFIFRLSAALGMFLRHMPDMYSSMQPLAEKLGTSEEEPLLGEIYPCLERISFDYGIMEKERNISVIPGDFGWSDIGAWNTLDDIMPADEQQNIIRADHLGIDTTGCVIFSDDNRLIATLGITDLVIVSTGDSLLICPRDRAQEIRKLTDLLEKHNRRDLL